jgi:hypothetical protein
MAVTRYTSKNLSILIALEREHIMSMSFEKLTRFSNQLPPLQVLAGKQDTVFKASKRQGPICSL